MRSSYYSDRRFKRGSLTHELCSKIEVTAERELSSRPGHLLSPPISPPFSLSLSSSQPFPHPRRLRSPSLLIRRMAHLVFVSTIYFLFVSGERTLLFGFSPPLAPSSLSLSISRFDPIRSAEDNPRNLLFGISWIIINAYAVAGGIDRPVNLLLFLVSPSPPPPHHSPLLPSVASNTSVRRRTTTVA